MPSKFAFSDTAFVGRDREIAVLRDLMKIAAAGQEMLVTVEALSGRGKTRILREFSNQVPSNTLILSGQGLDQSAKRPFQLFVGVAKGLITKINQDQHFRHVLSTRLQNQREALLAILPELKVLWDEKISTDIGPETFGEDRGLRALVSLINSLGSDEHPALLLLDDCQWADELALKLLSAWRKESHNRQRLSSPLLVVVAYRSEEVARDGILRTLEPDGHIELTDLDLPGSRLLVESMAGSISDEVMQMVWHLSSGSPFMAATVLRGFAELGLIERRQTTWQVSGKTEKDDWALSREASTFLRRRIELLPPKAIRLLKTAAVLGKEFEAQLVAQVAGTDLEQTAHALEEAFRRQIIRPAAMDGHYAFAHDKIRETLLSLLNTEEYRQLNCDVAKVLQKSHPERVFDLAYFFDAAREYDSALPYALRAAEEARTRSSLQIADHQYRLAMKGIAGKDLSVQYRLYQGFGDVLMLRGQYDEAGQAFGKARSAAQTQLESLRIDEQMGELMFKRSQTDLAIAELARTLTSLGITPPSSEAAAFFRLLPVVAVQIAHTLFPSHYLASRPPEGAEMDFAICRLLNRLAYAYWFYNTGKLTCFWSHLKSMNRAELYPPSAELGHCYSSHAMAMTLFPYFSRGIKYGAKAVQLCHALNDVWSKGQALHFYGDVTLCAGRYKEALDSLTESVKLLERSGDLWERNIANCNVAYVLYRMGALAEARRIGQQTVYEAIDSEDKQSCASALSAWSKAAGGDIPEEPLSWARERISATDNQALAELGQAQALRLIFLGKTTEARELLEVNWRRVYQIKFYNEYVSPVGAWLLTALRLELQSLGTTKTAEARALLKKARVLQRQALPLARRYRNNLAHALRECGLIAALERKQDRAIYFLRESVAAAKQISASFEHALSLSTRGSVGMVFNVPGSQLQRDEGLMLLQEQDNEKVAKLFFF